MSVPYSYPSMALLFLAGAISACQPRSSVDTGIIETSSPEIVVEVEVEQAIAPEIIEAPVSAEGSEAQDLSYPKPLNLDLSHTIPAHEEVSGFEEKSVLPDLFNNEKETNVSTSARLLIDEENPDAVKSIDGLEINIQKKL